MDVSSRPPRTLTNEQDPKYIWHKTPAGLYRMPVAYCLQCRQRNVRSPANGRTPHRILHCAGRDAANPKRRTDRRQSLRHRRICLLYGQQKHAENGHPELHVQSEGNTHRRQLHLDVLSLEILAQQPGGQIELLRLRTIQHGQFQRIRQCTKRTARHRIYPAPVRKRTDRPFLPPSR